jgi:dCTP diphosphatase
LDGRPRREEISPITNSQTTIADLTRLIRDFTQERQWEPFHHPKDLGLALAIEVGELLEHFRYRTNEEIEAYLANDDHQRELSHEVADCVWLLLRLADVCRFDLADALKEKLRLAALKYPADKVRGKPDKYTAYLPKPTPGESAP